MILWLLLESAAGEGERPWREDFLSPRERERLASLRFPRRRREWLLGRYAAKVLLSRVNPALAGLPLETIEIVAGADGAPGAVVNGKLLNGALSISHRAGLVFVAWRPEGERLGVDVERIEHRQQVFVEDYFTLAEQEALTRLPSSQRTLAVTLLWSLKEAALKALRQGLRLDTRRIEVALPDLLPSAGNWCPCEVSLAGTSARWVGYWRKWGDCVLTAVSGEERPALEATGYLVEVGDSLW